MRKFTLFLMTLILFNLSFAAGETFTFQGFVPSSATSIVKSSHRIKALGNSRISYPMFISSKNSNIVKNIRRGGSVSESSSSNASAMLGSLSFRRPLNSSRVSAGYLGYPGHRGIDFPSPQGTPVMAAESGTVTTVLYSNKSYGNRVIIDHGNGISTLYGHNSSISVSLGQKVSKGQTIAGVGSTGRSTGNHVHFEIRINGKPINPTSYVR